MLCTAHVQLQNCSAGAGLYFTWQTIRTASVTLQAAEVSTLPGVKHPFLDPPESVLL